MFRECKLLTNVNLINFNTQNVIDMNSIFDGCKSLTNVDLSILNTENVNDMRYIFYYCFLIRIIYFFMLI